MKPKWMRADAPATRYNRKSFEGRIIYATDDRKLIEAQGYLAAFFLRRHRLETYALTLVFNHDHGALGHPPPDATPETVARYSDYYRDFRAWNSRLVKQQGWKHGPVYTPLERTWDAPVLDAEELLRGLAYIMGQAVKDGLYRRAKDYPGVCLLPENVTKPVVFKRNAYIQKLDPDRVYFPDDEISLQLDVPAPFRHLGRERYQQLLEKALADYEAEQVKPRASRRNGDHACRRARLGTQFAKYRKRLHTRGKLPPQPDPGPRPPFTSDEELELAYKAERRTFWRQHAQALALKRAGEADVVFPAGTYGRARDLNAPVSCSGKPCWADQPRWWPD